MINVVLVFREERHHLWQPRKQGIPLMLGQPGVAVHERDQVKEDQQPGADRHRTDKPQVQEQFVEPKAAAKIKNKQRTADHHWPRRKKGSQTRDAGIR